MNARNYDLAGPECAEAEKRGLVSAEWYQPNIARARLKELMQRTDGPAIRDTLIWFAGLGLFGWLGVHFRRSLASERRRH